MASLQSRIADLITAIGADIKTLTGKFRGTSELVYRYTVTGADKASIDTTVDAAQAGSNDWTNGDVLEIFIINRTDDAGASANVQITLNNDTGNNYDYQRISGTNATATVSATLAAANWTFATHGSGGTASYPVLHTLVIPGFSNTTFFKVGHLTSNEVDGTAANNQELMAAIGYRSTSAINRVKIAAVSTAKLKVGTQILIYKRRAS